MSGRLAVQLILEFQRVPVEAVLLIADPLDGRADDALDLLDRARDPLVVLIDALAPDLAGEDDAVGGGQRLAGDARLRILGQEQIDDRVGNLVGDLVGMAFGNRFGREEIIAAHRWCSILLRKGICRYKDIFMCGAR